MIAPFETTRDGFTISTDPARLDMDLIHRTLSTESYWAQGRSFQQVSRAFAHSLPFGVHTPDGTLVGWARVITDYTTFAYLADVWVMATHRGRGLSKMLMGAILAHPELQDLRRWTLFTRDAQGLYQQFGFTPIAEPGRAMERRQPPVSSPSQ
ncbi:MAG TPA: GNAT family N-acetyltransferase [Aliidongia sp.]|uniref:GNAT family N-acetyltransferase n=1 Tax=Aliidongia sp. TaxID=1914230 RepID=UPI002DDD0FF1|nr:GNAT family N-acetyltransferase [Aliidongia sp.]HEV2676494.1 GNAT family N-acetyltransferase [Aliidongia sp.]